jgi:hypothetical protein
MIINMKDKWDRMSYKERNEYLDNMLATGQAYRPKTKHYIQRYFFGIFPYWKEIK